MLRWWVVACKLPCSTDGSRVFRVEGVEGFGGSCLGEWLHPGLAARLQKQQGGGGGRMEMGEGGRNEVVCGGVGMRWGVGGGCFVALSRSAVSALPQ